VKQTIRYDKIIDRITDAFFIIDEKGLITYASSSVSTILGHSPDELTGRSALEFIHPDEHHFAYSNQEILLSYPGSRLTHDYRIVNSHQSYQWMEFTFVNMINIPQVGGIMAQMRDVSERKSVELMLEEVKEQFRLFMSRIPATICLRDSEDRYVFVNEAFENWTGKKGSDLLGRTFYEVFPGSAESIADTDRLCRDFGKEIEYMETGPDKHGVIRDLVIYKFPIPRANGKTLIGALGFDIRRITHSKAIIKEAEDKFKLIFDHSPDAIFIEDEQGIILDANKKACELQGIELQELIGMNILDLTPESKRGMVAEQFTKLWNGELSAVTSFTWAINGQEIPVEIHAGKIQHEGREALVLTLRNNIRVV
jgi:PAS domain S-box-containing protein